LLLGFAPAQRILPSGVDLTSYRPDDALMYGLTPPDTTPANSSAWSSHRWDTADRLGSIATKYRISAGACLAECLVEELESKRGWNFSIPQQKRIGVTSLPTLLSIIGRR